MRIDDLKGVSDYCNWVCQPILDGIAYKATFIINPKLTIKATRVRYQGKIPSKFNAIDIRLTIGKPNYEERQYIKKHKGNIDMLNRVITKQIKHGSS